MEEEEDLPHLSAETMKALVEFYQEQLEKENIQSGTKELEENWNLSQFWYNNETANKLADESLRLAEPNGKIACVSCPSLYKAIAKKKETADAKLLEYDERFSIYKEDFIFYDYNAPLDFPKDLMGQFDIVIADPPYLSKDCFTKTAVTVKALIKQEAKIIICTGAIMEDLAYKLLSVNKCILPIVHNSGLSNPFCCYANYNLDDYCR